MPSSPKPGEPAPAGDRRCPATAVWFAGDLLWLRLADGRELGAPLEWFPRLAGAAARRSATAGN